MCYQISQNWRGETCSKHGTVVKLTENLGLEELSSVIAFRSVYKCEGNIKVHISG
jgi:hypothetical protein